MPAGADEKGVETHRVDTDEKTIETHRVHTDEKAVETHRVDTDEKAVETHGVDTDEKAVESSRNPWGVSHGHCCLYSWKEMRFRSHLAETHQCFSSAGASSWAFSLDFIGFEV